jgi:hypothetical protein
LPICFQQDFQQKPSECNPPTEAAMSQGSFLPYAGLPLLIQIHYVRLVIYTFDLQLLEETT